MKVPTNPKPQFLVHLACFLVYIITGILAENEQQVIASLNFWFRCPSLDYVRCADGILCIHKRWMCDGRIDCSDHSDEDDAVCSKRPRQGNLDGSHRYVPRTAKCPKRWFSCMDGSKCVSPRYVCDRKNDCKFIAALKCDVAHDGVLM
ncbi:Low-density lipoprotein receptor domain class A [Cooperia oncophora]